MNASGRVRASEAEQYLRLIRSARHVAGRILCTPSAGLVGATAYLHRASRELVESVPDDGPDALIGEGVAFECLRRVLAAWPDLAAGRFTGEQVFAHEPFLWKRAMTEWPMGEFARLTADVLVQNGYLDGRVLELGAGVGSCSVLVAPHARGELIRTDQQPALLRRLRIGGTVDRYDFNKPGPWRDLDTVFAVNALHCAKDKLATLGFLRTMLRPGGVLVFGEGSPRTDERGTPWALNVFFGLFAGWWDIGGFLPRDRWAALLEEAGFRMPSFARVEAGSHDLGGTIWAVK